MTGNILNTGWTPPARREQARRLFKAVHLPKRQTHRAYFTMPEGIMFGMYHNNGSCDFECAIYWYSLVSYLKIFDNAFAALRLFQDVFLALAIYTNRSITPVQFIELLRERGFVSTDELRNGIE